MTTQNEGKETSSEAESLSPERIQAAADEVQRELAVRQRCYPDWVKQGRLSATEARDRFDRLSDAHSVVKRLAELNPVTGSRPF